jgi:hypothetical protein
MLAVPFFRSIYFHSSFLIFNSSFPLRGARPKKGLFMCENQTPSPEQITIHSARYPPFWFACLYNL